MLFLQLLIVKRKITLCTRTFYTKVKQTFVMRYKSKKFL